METLLVTGATGFIGKHFIRLLKEAPYKDLYKVVLLSSVPIDGFVTVLHKNYLFTENAFINAGINQVDIVIHIGAFIPKNSNESNDISKNNENIKTLDCLLTNLPGIPKKFIFLSTVDVYDPAYNDIITEQSPVFPGTLYGWSKLYGEKMIAAWAVANKTVCQTLRIGHVYGPGEEKYQKFIPTALLSIIKNTSLEVWGDGSEKRSFIYVEDVCHKILKSILLNRTEGPINICSQRAVCLNELIAISKSIANKDCNVRYKERVSPTRNLVFNIDKMIALLGPEHVSLEQGLLAEYTYLRSLSE